MGMWEIMVAAFPGAALVTVIELLISAGGKVLPTDRRVSGALLG